MDPEAALAWAGASLTLAREHRASVPRDQDAEIDELYDAVDYLLGFARSIAAGGEARPEWIVELDRLRGMLP
jgi:hypothetical protein